MGVKLGWVEGIEVNVLGLLRVTQALLPALRASGDGLIVNVGSTAGRIAYEGGAGYTAAKHGTQVVTETLRLELVGEPIRISEIAPGMVRTEEFAKVRFLYNGKLGIGDRCEIEFFAGPHTIHGVGTFDFLHKHLDWPKR